MFTTLNLRWMIDLKERETRALERAANTPQQHWLRTLVSVIPPATLPVGIFRLVSNTA